MKAIYRFFIRLYQTHLSPHKGYRCAYSLEKGGPGCSGAVLRILEEDGLIRGWTAIQRRFDECSDSAKERARRSKQKKKNGNGSGNSCYGAEDACELISCRSGKNTGCDTPSCDVPSCDAPSCTTLTVSLWLGLVRALFRK